MKIGNIEIDGRTVLAPLAGITDLPYRLICKELGAALVYTEMISAEGLVRGQVGTVDITESAPDERPVAFQIFGRSPVSMAEAARILAEKGADIVDINMGCPVKKVTRSGSGAALLKDLDTAETLVKAVVDASRAPVTVKLRSGWTSKDRVSVELAKAAEAAGAAAVAVHARFAKQGFAGKADWSVIAAVKDAVSIPVIGNGDVCSCLDAKRMVDETGCDAVMIGRGALGNPWVFREVEAYLATGGQLAPPSSEERGVMLVRHLRSVVARAGELAGVRMMRKHGAWYSKGIVGCAGFRRRINMAETLAEFEDAVNEFFRVGAGFAL